MMNNDIYNVEYQAMIFDTIQKALALYSRVTVIRCDLRFPVEMTVIEEDSSIISRFIYSLKSKIKYDLKYKEKKWGRALFCHLHYIWVREFGDINNRKHYHILIFFNKDVYHSLGDFTDLTDNLSAMIRQAWCSALGLNYMAFFTLVHFGKILHLDRNRLDIHQQVQALIEYANYLAKHETKLFGDGYRSIGTSQ